MSKRTSNKKAKQMIADVVLQGRKAFWHSDGMIVVRCLKLERIQR